MPYSAFRGILTLQNLSHEPSLSKNSHREWLLEALRAGHSEGGAGVASPATNPANAEKS